MIENICWTFSPAILLIIKHRIESCVNLINFIPDLSPLISYQFEAKNVVDNQIFKVTHVKNIPNSRERNILLSFLWLWLIGHTKAKKKKSLAETKNKQNSDKEEYENNRVSTTKKVDDVEMEHTHIYVQEHFKRNILILILIFQYFIILNVL